ncbi:MAG: SDR family NAD(P)-dependent oxidoreductase [Myxococcota bacterium]
MASTAKVAMVTGATGVIGGAIARGLRERGYTVILAGRDPVRTRWQAKALGAGTRTELVDVSRRTWIRAMGRRFDGPLDVLINNAATTPQTREQTPEGIELQWATNVLGYLWMVDALEPALRRAPAPRVGNIASYWAGDLDLEDPEFKRRPYDNDTAYRSSKQADRMLTVALAEALRPAGITVNACHPGDLPSTLARNLGFGGSDTPEQAAATPLMLATDPTLADTSGAWFQDQREVKCHFGRDRAGVNALMARLAQWR